VLWVMVAASVLALGGQLAARDSVSIGSNRVDAERAAWRANDCLSRVRTAADEALAQAEREDAVLRRWRALDRAVFTSPLVALDWCDARMEAAGSRIDVNAADARQLVAAFRALQLPEPEALADRLVESLPFADVRELKRVAGFETIAGLDDVLGVEKGRTCINTAPPAVLAILPGFTYEIVSRIEVLRQSGRQIEDILALAAQVSPASRDSLVAHFAELSERVTLNPEAWIVVVRASSGDPGARRMNAFADARLILGHGRAVLTRRRSWL